MFLVDNSPTDTLKDVVTMYPDKEIHYIFNNENMGYGKAHNIAIKKSMEQGLPYHIVLNPDIVIQEGALEKLTHYMNEHPEVGNIMPKIIYPDGQLQYLCKLPPLSTSFLGVLSLLKNGEIKATNILSYTILAITKQ